MNAEMAWTLITGERRLKIAVIDTGVDCTHPDLKDNMWTNKAELKGLPYVDDDGNGFKVMLKAVEWIPTRLLMGE